MTSLHHEIAACRVCETSLDAGARPVVQFSSPSRLVIIGQAPGRKVHESGVSWGDASGDRLCDWLGLSQEALHDPAKIALIPMGFCYPGKGKSGDLPPRKECAPLWHRLIFETLPAHRLTLLVGTYAQAAYLPEARRVPMVERIRDYRSFLPRYFPLPHPSWRSTIFMRSNPWFEAEVLPELKRQVAAVLN